MSAPQQMLAAPDGSTRLLLHCDGADASTTFTDSSRYGLTVTANGNAQIDTAQSKFGGASALFDGSGDFLSIADDHRLEVGGSIFTFECWVRASSLTSTRTIAGKRGNATSQGHWLLRANAGQLQVYLSTDGASWATSMSGSTISTGTWYHVALVRIGSTFTLYLDGVSDATATLAGRLNDNSSSLRIGGDSNGAYWNGWIDEVRYKIGEAVYTSGFTPPSGAFTS